jgi:hypothetical protein
MTDQPLDLDAIEARAAATRPGPWTARDDLSGDGYPGHLWIVQNPDDGPGENHIVISIGDRLDAEFIAAARTDVPALAAAVRRLTAELATMTAVAESNKRYVQSMYQDLQQAQQQAAALATVKVWRNEDGREFLFADDVRAALGTTTPAQPGA